MKCYNSEFHLFLFIYFHMATRKFKITCVTLIFLMDSTGLEPTFSEFVIPLLYDD